MGRIRLEDFTAMFAVVARPLPEFCFPLYLAPLASLGTCLSKASSLPNKTHMPGMMSIFRWTSASSLHIWDSSAVLRVDCFQSLHPSIAP